MNDQKDAMLLPETVKPEDFIQDVKDGKIQPKQPTILEMIQTGIRTLFEHSKTCKDGSLDFKNDEERMEWATKRFRHLSEKIRKQETPVLCDTCKKPYSDKTTGPLRRTISNTYIHQNCM